MEQISIKDKKKSNIGKEVINGKREGITKENEIVIKIYEKFFTRIESLFLKAIRRKIKGRRSIKCRGISKQQQLIKKN